MTGLLSDVRVLDLGQRVSDPYCAKTLANMGADVIRVEPPDGDESRKMGPFPGNESHPEKSGVFLALNANKYGVTLDLGAPDDVQKLRELVKTVDIIVENFLPDRLDELGLGYEALKELNPGVILTSISSGVVQPVKRST